MDKKEVETKEESVIEETNKESLDSNPETNTKSNPETNTKSNPETNTKSNPETNPESNTNNSEDDAKKEELKKKQNRQLIWAIVLMVSVIVIIIAVPYLRDNYFNKFNYHGMEFQKKMFGDVEFYSTKLPLFSKSGSVNPGTGFVVQEVQPERKQTGAYELVVRQDPRDLDNVKVNLDINNITFIKNRILYVTYGSDGLVERLPISAADLARFLLNFGNLDAEGAAMDKDYAEENDIPYVTCENHPLNTVIMVVAGDESEISKINDNCYELKYAKGEVLEVTNKFILSVAEGYVNSLS